MSFGYRRRRSGDSPEQHSRQGSGSMAHHGHARHPRFSRTKRKYRPEEYGDGVVAGTAGGLDDQPPASTLAHGNVISRFSGEQLDAVARQESEEPEPSASDWELFYWKRQQIETSQGVLTTVVASTVIDAVDRGSQTSGDLTDVTLPITINPLDNPLTVPVNTGSAAVPTSTALVGTSGFPSPAYPSPSPATPSSTRIDSLASPSVAPSSVPVSPKASPTQSSSAGIPNTNSTTPSTVLTATSSSTSTTSVSSSSGSSVSFDWDTDFSSTSDSSTTSTTFGSPSSTTWVAGVGGIGATGSGQSSPTGSSSTQDAGTSSDEATRKIVGGVVGAVGGIVLLVIAALFLLHRRKQFVRRTHGALISDQGATNSAAGEKSISRSAEMTSRRSSHEPLFAAALSPSFVKRWRQSNQTTTTESTMDSGTSERGFQKISGRKIPSVLRSGGDGYGGGIEGDSPTATEPSIVLTPSSPVHSRPPASQPPPTTNPYGMPLDVSYTRESEESDAVVVFRSSPARTPVASSINVASPSIPQPQSALVPAIPKRPDGLGRSHPSYDGSRGSRFTESLDI